MATREEVLELISKVGSPKDEFYLGLLEIPMSDLRRTGSPDIADEMEHYKDRRHEYLLDEHGALKEFSLEAFPGLGFMSLDYVCKAGARSKTASSLESGDALFTKLMDFRGDRKELKQICEAAPNDIKIDYINRVAQAFATDWGVRKKLQSLVNGNAEFHGSQDDEYDFDQGNSLRRSHTEDAHRQGLGYIAKALGHPLKSGKDDHPAILVLDYFIRTLDAPFTITVPEPEPEVTKTGKVKREHPGMDDETAAAAAKLFGWDRQ